MAKFVLAWFGRLNADSQLRLAEAHFEDPNSLKTVGGAGAGRGSGRHPDASRWRGFGAGTQGRAAWRCWIRNNRRR